ncbi:hypothetical protein GN956_G18611 [Arapaima gigas]
MLTDKQMGGKSVGAPLIQPTATRNSDALAAPGVRTPKEEGNRSCQAPARPKQTPRSGVPGGTLPTNTIGDDCEKNQISDATDGAWSRDEME